MKTLVGGLEISYTSYKSLNFLAGLQKIEARTGVYISNNDKLEELRLTDLTSINGTSFTVSGNKNLKRLILPNLKNVQLKNPWSWMTSISISENSRNLCMTLPEAKTLLNYKKISNIYMEGNICNAGNLAKKSCLVPKIGCENLVGDLKIGQKFGFKKVKSLKFLYGSLIIKNSSLTDFKVFPNLLEIVQLKSTKLAIDVQGNKKLQNATFPKLQRVYSLAINTTTFENNHNSLKKDFKSCYSIRKAIYQGREQFDNDPIFDGLKCEEMQNGGKKKF
ncbi:unnamed protein product [Caenorhabditis nigoni]